LNGDRVADLEIALAVDRRSMPPEPAGDLALAHAHLHQAAQAASLLKAEVLYLCPMAAPDKAGSALGLRVYERPQREAVHSPGTWILIA
jgi:hypothetical protein